MILSYLGLMKVLSVFRSRDEINQYKKMKLSNAGGYDDGTISYENMLSGGSSLMLASLTRERQIVSGNLAC